MAGRARLSAPAPVGPLAPAVPESPRAWPYHEVIYRAVAVRALAVHERRFEAEVHLSEGSDLRAAIEAAGTAVQPLGAVARIWMPGRLKGVQVGRDVGTPFLAATQVYDIQPVPRKWLALKQTADAKNRFVQQGQVLVTCSGSVGRPTLATAAHEGVLISHDLLRIEPRAPELHGWLYAYLLAPSTRAMATGAQYGHIIKHLEEKHLAALPIPKLPTARLAGFNAKAKEVLRLRNEYVEKTRAAETQYESAFAKRPRLAGGDAGFTVKASAAFAGGRRRLEAAFHRPEVRATVKQLAAGAARMESLRAAGYEAWLPSRFKRVPATDGVLLVDSADLTEVNPDLTKRIAEVKFGDASNGRVEKGWILLARSGQTYGIIGTPVLAGADLLGKVVSDHVMRVRRAKDDAPLPGYLLTALAHPTLGRPRVKALAYGSSIPEIEVEDLLDFEIPRLDAARELAIAVLAEAAAAARARADMLERELADEAEAVLQGVISQ